MYVILRLRLGNSLTEVSVDRIKFNCKFFVLITSQESLQIMQIKLIKICRLFMVFEYDSHLSMRTEKFDQDNKIIILNLNHFYYQIDLIIIHVKEHFNYIILHYKFYHYYTCPVCRIFSYVGNVFCDGIESLISFTKF